jgi:hypothetical protein
MQLQNDECRFIQDLCLDLSLQDKQRVMTQWEFEWLKGTNEVGRMFFS